MFDYWVSERMDFTTEDKRECFETAKIIVELAEKVRGGGVLALESEIDKMPDILLKKAIELFVDGVREDDIRKTLQNWIIAGNYRGRRLFKRLLITEGMLAIHNGCNPGFIRDEVLASYFGENMLPEYTAYFNRAFNIPRTKITVGEFLNQIKDNRPGKFGETGIFEDFDDMAMQELLRGISQIYIIRVIRSLPDDVVVKFLNNMSKRNAEMIMESCLAMRYIRETDAADAYENILAAAKKFTNQ